jgi:hypothetical protein
MCPFKKKEAIPVPSLTVMKDILGSLVVKPHDLCHNLQSGCACISCPARARKTKHWPRGCPLEHEYSQTCHIGIFLTACAHRGYLLKEEADGKKERGKGFPILTGNGRPTTGLSGLE